MDFYLHRFSIAPFAFAIVRKIHCGLCDFVFSFSVNHSSLRKDWAHRQHSHDMKSHFNRFTCVHRFPSYLHLLLCDNGNDDAPSTQRNKGKIIIFIANNTQVQMEWPKWDEKVFDYIQCLCVLLLRVLCSNFASRQNCIQRNRADQCWNVRR